MFKLFILISDLDWLLGVKLTKFSEKALMLEELSCLLAKLFYLDFSVRPNREMSESKPEILLAPFKDKKLQNFSKLIP